MAYYSDKNNWVTFDDEEVGKQDMIKVYQSMPRTISGADGVKSTSYLSSSLSSISSASSFSSISSMDTFCRGTSPVSTSPDNTRYQIKDIQSPLRSDVASNDSKYSVFSSLRESEKKGEYLGWSK